MKILLGKIVLYGIIIFILLEVYVRVFQIHSDTPLRYIDAYGVEKRIPNQLGTYVTGNRRQHAMDYSINEDGFNTLRSEIIPNTNEKLALIGDSFIEGFHQDYNYSLGKMIEKKKDSLEVFEFGCGGYDLADQLYLVNAYKDRFKAMDHILVYLKYENDLDRPSTEPNYDRLERSKGVIAKLRQKSKFLSYVGDLGIINNFSQFLKSKKNIFKKEDNSTLAPKTQDSLRISNFENLLALYKVDTSKLKLLLDSSKTSVAFLAYCQQNNIAYIDFAEAFKQAKQQTTYIYDEHWNSYGREIIAQCIAGYLHDN